MFLAGEAGPEHVQVTPNGGGGAGTGQIVILNHIAGSMVTMDEIAAYTKKSLYNGMKDRGYTGY